MPVKFVLSTIRKYAPAKLWMELAVKLFGSVLQVFSVVWLLNFMISMLEQQQDFGKMFWCRCSAGAATSFRCSLTGMRQRTARPRMWTAH